jgi:adenine-specific DNA-methyltransferase
VQNVYPFDTRWPARTAAKTLVFEVTDQSEKLLVPAANYVLIRRFSAKEEARRLVASPLFAKSFGGRPFALENHLNYVYHVNRELTRHEVLGIAAMLNSRLLDVYFRTISGSTQVNAAEIRVLPFPELLALARLGRAVAAIESTDRIALERVVLETLGIDSMIYDYLTQEQSEGSGVDSEGAGDAESAAE